MWNSRVNLSCKTYSPTLEGSIGHTFTMTRSSKYVRGSPASLRSTAVALLCRSEIIMRIATIELGCLNAMEIIGSQGAREQEAALSYKSKVDVVTVMDNRVKVLIRLV